MPAIHRRRQTGRGLSEEEWLNDLDSQVACIMDDVGIPEISSKKDDDAITEKKSVPENSTNP